MCRPSPSIALFVGLLMRLDLTRSRSTTARPSRRLSRSACCWICTSTGNPPHSNPLVITLLYRYRDNSASDYRATLGLPLDNYEGMAIGPPLADGRRSLLLVNDNNFSVHQIGTQFILLALALED